MDFDSDETAPIWLARSDRWQERLHWDDSQDDVYLTFRVAFGTDVRVADRTRALTCRDAMSAITHALAGPSRCEECFGGQEGSEWGD